MQQLLYCWCFVSSCRLQVKNIHFQGDDVFYSLFCCPPVAKNIISCRIRLQIFQEMSASSKNGSNPIHALMLSARLQEGEAFTKTSCYHYFHCHCLGRYASHSESELRQREKELEEDKTRDRTDYQVGYQRYEEFWSIKSFDVCLYKLFDLWLFWQELTVVCPVCREPLTYDVDQLLSSPAPQLPEVKPSSDVHKTSFQNESIETFCVLHSAGRSSDWFKLSTEVEWTPEAFGKTED